MLVPCLQLPDSDLPPNVVFLNQSKGVYLWLPSLHFCPSHALPFPLWHISDRGMNHFILLDQQKNRKALLPKRASSSPVSALLHSAFVRDF